MPFDQTSFGKFHMWQSVLLLSIDPTFKPDPGPDRNPNQVLLLGIAAFPGWYLRATFFTVILGCLMREMEEFQFVRFILGRTALPILPPAFARSRS